MAGPGLAVNNDTTYADSGTDPSVKKHQQDHDVIGTVLNKFDQATPTAGQALIWDATVGRWMPSVVKRYKSWLTDFVNGGFNVHRTGSGDHPYIITASDEAIQAAIITGQNFCDLDARYSDNGDVSKGAALWMIHNGNLEDYSDDISGDVKTTATSLVRAARMSPAKFTGGTYTPRPFTELGDMVARYGNQMLFECELKNSVSPTDFNKAVTLFENRLKGLGGGAINNVICMISLPGADEAHLAVFDAHPDVLWGVYASSSDTGFNTQSTYEALKARGCKFVGASLSTSASLRTWMEANFIGVSGYADRRTLWNNATAAGWANLGGEYGVYTSGRNTVIKRDPWRDGKQIYGLIPADNHTWPKLMRDGLLFDTNYGGQQWALAGDFAPIPNSCTIDFEYTIVRTGGQWYGITFGQTTDTSMAGGGSGQVDKTGYIAWMADNGRVYLYEGNGTTFNNLGSTATGTAVGGNGSDGWLRVVINATQIVVSQLDPVTGTVLNSYTSTSTTYRGGYLSVGSQLNTTGVMKVRRLTIA